MSEEAELEVLEDKIGNQLEECADLLLACELEDKKCKKCKKKADCLLFIRSVLAALCKIEVARMLTGDKKIPEHLYS